MDSGRALADLRWLQLHDSAFPSGRFVHSNGLESWLAARPEVGDAEIAGVARAQLTRAVAPLDAVAAGLAWAAVTLDEQVALDRLVWSFRLAESARTAAQGPGRQLAIVAGRVLPPAEGLEFVKLAAAGAVPSNECVVEGVIARALGIDRFAAVLGLLRTRYAGLLSVAVRVGRAGPMWAQRELFAAGKLIVGLAERALASGPDDLTSCAPELEIHAMRHESAATRMFTT